MSKSTTLLIDGDLIVYRSCAAVEKEVRWDEDNHVLYSNEEEAWTAVKFELDKLFTRFDTDKHVIALTSGVNFRLSIDPTYKSNRRGNRKPMALPRIRERLEGTYRVVKFDSLEADDVLGIFATRDPATILCSQDKDMKTIPCTLWNGTEVLKVSEVDADLFHLTQTLVGDTTDGYPGCPGIGPVKAQKIIQDAVDAEAHLSGSAVQCVWPAVVKAFEKAKLTEEDALRQARLARILRSSDWNAEKKEPILWQPSR